MLRGLAFAAGLLVILATVDGSRTSRTAAHLDRHRTKQREIRGYKPEYISTAIGFGKREGSGTYGIPKLNEREKILLSLLETIPDGIPLESLLRQRNMKFGTLSTADDDGRRTATLLRLSPERRIVL